MLREYCLWEGNKLPKDAIKFKVARPSVLGVPKHIWEKFRNGEMDFKEYSEAYMNWAWRSPKARERIKLIARRVKRNKVKDVYLGCYCRDYPCHRFTLLLFFNDRFGCEVDPVALKKMGEQPIRSLADMFKELDEEGLLPIPGVGRYRKHEIPAIDCECGAHIVPKPGAVQINCRCGRTYRLYISKGAGIISRVSEEELLRANPRR